MLIPKFRIFERWIFPAKIALQKPMYRCYDPLKKRPPNATTGRQQIRR